MSDILQKLLVLLKSLNFLKALCYLIEAVFLAFWPDHALASGALLLAVVAVLNFFGVFPELRARGLLKKSKK